MKALRFVMLATPHGRILMLTRRVLTKLGSKIKKASAAKKTEESNSKSANIETVEEPKKIDAQIA